MIKTIGLIGIFLFFVFYFFSVFIFYKVVRISTREKGEKISNFGIFKRANTLAMAQGVSFILLSKILEKIILVVYGKGKRAEDLKVLADAKQICKGSGIVLEVKPREKGKEALSAFSWAVGAELLDQAKEEGVKCVVCEEKAAEQIEILPKKPLGITYYDGLLEISKKIRGAGESVFYISDFPEFNKKGFQVFCSQECLASYVLWLLQHNLPKNRWQKLLWPLILHYYRSRRRLKRFLYPALYGGF